MSALISVYSIFITKITRGWLNALVCAEFYLYETPYIWCGFFPSSCGIFKIIASPLLKYKTTTVTKQMKRKHQQTNTFFLFHRLFSCLHVVFHFCVLFPNVWKERLQLGLLLQWSVIIFWRLCLRHLQGWAVLNLDQFLVEMSQVWCEVSAAKIFRVVLLVVTVKSCWIVARIYY